VSRRASGDHPNFKTNWGNNLGSIMGEMNKPTSSQHDGMYNLKKYRSIVIEFDVWYI